MGLWSTKSMASLQNEATVEGEHSLKRALGATNLVLLGIGAIIGAGIFVLTGTAAANYAGNAVVLSFILAGLACAFAGLCYAEFASMIPIAGSAYTYGYATLGEFVAWIIGWDLILEFAIGAAVVAKGWSSYLGQVFGFSGGIVDVGPLELDWGALLIVVIVSTLLGLGTKLSSNFSAVITSIKVAVVLLVVIVGAFYIKTANYSPFIPPAETADASGTGINQSLFSLLTGAEGSHFGVYGLLAGASIVFFAFIGFDVVATTAEETKDPQRDVAKGILASLAVVTVLYVAVSVVLSGMVHYTALKTGPDGKQANLATAFAANGVDWAATVISIGALAGLTTVVMVLMLGQSRVLFAMARDGLLPRALAKTGPHGTPVRVTVLVAILIAVAASVFPIGKLEEMVNVGTLFAFVLVSAGVLVLRRSRPDLKRGFRVPWVPLVPIASIVACVWLMLNLTALTWIRFLIWMALGVVIYLVYGRSHSVQGQREATV